jgi:hypothetical protein
MAKMLGNWVGVVTGDVSVTPKPQEPPEPRSKASRKKYEYESMGTLWDFLALKQLFELKQLPPVSHYTIRNIPTCPKFLHVGIRGWRGRRRRRRGRRRGRRSETCINKKPDTDIRNFIGVNVHFVIIKSKDFQFMFIPNLRLRR